jgi:hypothetical protein
MWIALATFRLLATLIIIVSAKVVENIDFFGLI